ncbi:sugar ABC transporter ATP-binding protein [Microbacterium sediminicola]|uniref:Sugar ABC transporter ATP-binding protein n=1 Tax=Microbacterium sediminicola TaxID=415210 RepID=A0ABN2IHZ0_9MICO
MTTERRGTDPREFAFSARGVSKTFGHFRALVGAHLTVRRGTVHALLGGNGSGKSTFIKCLAGVYGADAGELSIKGETLDLAAVSPDTAHALGLRFVHQDLGLFPQLSIAENVALGLGYPTRWTAVREKALQQHAQRLIDTFEIDARPTTRVADLRPSQRAMLAIARALDDAESSDSILLLDEPTAALGEHDAQDLMHAIRRRADEGQTIVLVSHRFNEISAVADDVTVFRDGRNAGSGPIADMPLSQVVSLMTGDEAREMPASYLVHSPGPISLAVDGLDVGTCRDASFDVGTGEVLGFAGLDGSGHSDALAGLFGALSSRARAVTLEGADFRPRSPEQAMAQGAAFIPQDRHSDAAFANLSITQNLSVTILDRIWNGFALSGSREHEAAADTIDRFSIRAASAEAPLGVLSGGNQQKVILGRWLQRSPRLLLLVEPTQGVDVVARHDIYTSIAAAARAGATVLVASSDVDELLAITHRIAIFRGGRVAAVLPTASATRDEITNAMLAEESVDA